jgi:nitrate reductase NapAB chaperone NapD
MFRAIDRETINTIRDLLTRVAMQQTRVEELKQTVAAINILEGIVVALAVLEEKQEKEKEQP